MDTKKRTIAKAFCWQGVGLIVMTIIGYIFTGSASAGGGGAGADQRGGRAGELFPARAAVGAGALGADTRPLTPRRSPGLPNRQIWSFLGLNIPTDGDSP